MSGWKSTALNSCKKRDNIWELGCWFWLFMHSASKYNVLRDKTKWIYCHTCKMWESKARPEQELQLPGDLQDWVRKWSVLLSRLVITHKITPAGVAEGCEPEQSIPWNKTGLMKQKKHQKLNSMLSLWSLLNFPSPWGAMSSTFQLQWTMHRKYLVKNIPY